MVGGPGPPIEEKLQAALGPAVVVRRLSSSPRSRVWLTEFGGAPAIVKQVTGGTDDAARYERETTALRLAGRVLPAVVPALLATDPDAGILVLEYLTPARQAGEDWMTEYAVALARLHSATGAADASTLPAWAGPGAADVGAFTGLVRQFGVPVSPALSTELDGLVARLDPAGTYALLHGDPCPDNEIHTETGIRFLDLEQAALGYGAIELAYLRVGFPTCWCARSVSGPALRKAEAAYRSAWRELTGNEIGGDLADACAGWLISGDALVERAHRGRGHQLARVPQKDWRWGTATARQRLVHRLGVVATVGADRPGLAELARVSSALRERMLERWPSLRPLPSAEGNPMDDARRFL